MYRNQFLDFSKGVLIILVTTGHAIQFAVYRGVDFWMDPLFKAIYMFHMPLFMAISGYLAFPGINKSSLISLSINKIKSYALPILVWACIYKITIFAIDNKIKLSNLPLLVIKEFTGSLWFLWALLASIILTAAVKSLRDRFWAYYLFLLIIVMLLPEKGVIIMFKKMFPFFQIGYIIASVKISDYNKLGHYAMFLSAFVASVLVFNLWTKETYVYVSGMVLSSWNISNIGLRFMAGVSVSVFAVYLFHWIYKHSNPLLTKIVSGYGADSIYIYIIQGYVFVAVERLVAQNGFPETNIVLGSIIAFCLGLIIASSCLFAGRFLARSTILKSCLFGRYSYRNKISA